MSVQTEIDRLASAKAAIKTAIEGKGVTVPDATLLDGMAALIEGIDAGGLNNYLATCGSVTYAEKVLIVENPLIIAHGLQTEPCAFFAIHGTSSLFPQYQLNSVFYSNYKFGTSRSSYPCLTYSTKAGVNDLGIKFGSSYVTVDDANVTITVDSNNMFVGGDSAIGTLTWVALARK